MSKNIYVEGLNEIPVPMKKVEIVERKGIGHPDSVACTGHLVQIWLV